MTEHLPKCNLWRVCPNADEHDICKGHVTFCIHCTRECMCHALRLGYLDGLRAVLKNMEGQWLHVEAELYRLIDEHIEVMEANK
jgi:hypothetical protein